MIKKFVILFFIFSYLAYPISNYESFEDSYIQIKCGKLKDSFFMVKYDIENDEIYIGLNSLFYFLEIYTLEINLKNMQVYGTLNEKNINVKFTTDEAFVTDGSIYANIKSIKEKLDFKSINFDFSLLSLSLEANFTLPYEIREKSKIERLRFEKEGEENRADILMPSKFISPGFLKIDWEKYNLNEKDYVLEYEYGTQFLYGDLYLSGEIHPQNKLEYGNLTYSDFWQGNDLVLGNYSMIVPHFLNVESDIIGLSFRDENTYMTRDGGITVIKGEAENVQVIELYRDFALIDYIYPETKNFEFRVMDGILNSDYTLKIFYNDGRIEEKKVFSLSDMDILQKGKNRVSLQLGKNSNDGKNQGISHIYYGISDNLTLGLGIMDLITSENKNYQLLENDILFNTQHKSFPTLITYKNFYEIEKKENSYNLIIEQKFKDYVLRYLKEQYSPYIYRENRLKKYISVSLGKTFEKNAFEVGINDKNFFENQENYKSKNIYFSWYTSIFSPISLSLKMEKDLYRGYDYNVYYPSISYSGIFSIILDAEIGKEKEEENYTQNYNLRISKRDIELIKEKLYLDIGAFTRYSSIREKFRYGIAFNMKWDNYIHVGLFSSTNILENKERSTINSIETSKIINLKAPLEKIDNNASVNSSWIIGRVYLDKNGNHIFDSNEDIPLENVEVLVDNKGFITNKKGEYIADGISDNKIITLDINRKSLDLSYKNSDGEIKIKTKKSSTLRLDIPIQPTSILSGNIILGEEYTEKQFIQNLSLITIILEKDGEIVTETDPEFDGMYFFEDVLPGKYKIKFNYLGYENVEFSVKSIDIEINSSSEGEYIEGLDTEMIKKRKEEK